MEFKNVAEAILFIRPNAVFSLRNNQIEWLDENQTEPTEAEIKAGWVACQAAQKAEAEAKAQAKAELLERLGITADEAKLLLA
jgi:hypothetical protein